MLSAGDNVASAAFRRQPQGSKVFLQPQPLSADCVRPEQWLTDPVSTCSGCYELLCGTREWPPPGDRQCKGYKHKVCAGAGDHPTKVG